MYKPMNEFNLCDTVTPFADMGEPLNPLQQAYALLSLLECAFTDAAVVEAHRQKFVSAGLPADWPSRLGPYGVPDSEFNARNPDILTSGLRGIQTLVALGAYYASERP